MAWFWLLACAISTPLSDEQKAEIKTVSDAARVYAEPLEAARKVAIREAHNTTGPRPDMGPCPVRLPPPAPEEVGSFADTNITYALATTPISVVHIADIEKSDGPRWDRVQNTLVNDIDSLLIGVYDATDPTEFHEKVAKAKELADISWIPVDGTLVVTRHIPAVIDGKSFTSGQLDGRFYVYDYSKQAIVCAATVTVENSDTLGVHVHQDDAGALVGAVSDADRDLFKNGVREALKSLYVAGPLLVPIDPM